MSFSYDVKQELTCNQDDRYFVRYAKCYGMLLFSKRFSKNEIIFTTENKYVSEFFSDLVTSIFSSVLEISYGLKPRNSSHQLITTKILNTDDCNKIFFSYGYSQSDITLRINAAEVSETEQLSAFLSGVFMSCGNVTDPQKNYHLEFKVPYKKLAEDLITLLNCAGGCSFKPKQIIRNSYYIIYFKDSEQIADLLTFMGAFNSSMTVMGTKAMKKVRNNANRKVNSELHNIEKTAEASARQVKAIKKLMKSDQFNSLPEELKEIARLRLENPEMSLRNLGELTSDKISRSGVNHRLKRLLSYTE